MSRQLLKLRAIIDHESRAAYDAASIALNEARSNAAKHKALGSAGEQLDALARIKTAIDPYVVRCLDNYSEARIICWSKASRSSLNGELRKGVSSLFDQLQDLPKDCPAWNSDWQHYRRELEKERSKFLDRVEAHIHRSPAVNIFLQHPIISIFVVIILGWGVEKLLDWSVAAVALLSSRT